MDTYLRWRIDEGATNGESKMKIESSYKGIEYGELCDAWDDYPSDGKEAYFLSYLNDDDDGLGYPIVVVDECGHLYEYRHARKIEPKHAKKIEPKRELKATDLIGWWAKDGNDYVGPLRVDASEGLIGVNTIGHKLDNCDGWRFTKDPFIPLDQWLTLDQVREGLS